MINTNDWISISLLVIGIIAMICGLVSWIFLIKSYIKSLIHYIKYHHMEDAEHGRNKN